MSTWSDSCPVLPRNVEPFRYYESEGAPPSPVDATLADAGAHTRPDLAELERAAHARGVSEGMAMAKQQLHKEIEVLESQLRNALQSFADERHLYFAEVEKEVVQLALAIARRILNRESQIDDCLLSGLVRVTLERLENRTHVCIHARPELLEIWKHKLDWYDRKEIEWVPDNSIAAECCCMKTELGSTEISLDSQLKEIEQGFFDLLSHRTQIERPPRAVQ